MDLVLALKANLNNRGQTDPSKQALTAGGHYEFEFKWNLKCSPTVIIKDARDFSTELIKEIEGMEGELHLDMEVSSRGSDDENGIRLIVRDAECIVERIINLVSPESWEMYVQIMYLERVWSFSGYHYEKNLKGEGVMYDNGEQTLSVHQLLELLSDQINQDSFTATITLSFVEGVWN